MQIETLLSETGKEALNSVRRVIDPLWEPGKGDWRPPDEDRALTWALSKKEDQFVISILAEQEDSWATRQAKELEKLFPESVVWTTTGEAQSTYPDTGYAPHAVSRQIRPGVSIGHGRFRAGTLGCLVKVAGDESDTIGVLTAAHVVALNESVKEEDKIYSPGKPEIGKALVNDDVIGRLDNYVELIPIIKYEPGQDIFQSIDIAFVRIETKRKIPKWNEVPNPSDPENKSIRIRSVVPEDEMPNFINQKVYKFGRTTGFTVGKLVHHHIAQREIKLPNNKLYLYTEIFAVAAAASGEPFSRPGDSGAAVYTEEGSLLGFVIGADDSTTLCCMAERSLAAMKAQLVIGAKGT